MVINMQLNLEKHNFCKLDGIANIKNHLEKLTNVIVDGSKASGNVEINISYNDFEGMECFKSLNFTFDLDLEELKILEVILGRTNVVVVEGQGIDINYELAINYLPALDKDVEIEVIDESQIDFKPEEPKEENKSLDEIKEDIAEYYEEKLANNLNRSNKVITTKGRETVESFLNFFDSKASYYKLKCLYVESETELNNIAKEYNVSMEKLLAGYDRESRKVIFSIS